MFDRRVAGDSTFQGFRVVLRFYFCWKKRKCKLGIWGVLFTRFYLFYGKVLGFYETMLSATDKQIIDLSNQNLTDKFQLFNKSGQRSVENFELLGFVLVLKKNQKSLFFTKNKIIKITANPLLGLTLKLLKIL